MSLMADILNFSYGLIWSCCGQSEYNTKPIIGVKRVKKNVLAFTVG